MPKCINSLKIDDLDIRSRFVISMTHLTAPLSPKGIIQTIEAVLRLANICWVSSYIITQKSKQELTIIKEIE